VQPAITLPGRKALHKPAAGDIQLISVLGCSRQPGSPTEATHNAARYLRHPGASMPSMPSCIWLGCTGSCRRRHMAVLCACGCRATRL
jgi:hypothetical protein